MAWLTSGQLETRLQNLPLPASATELIRAASLTAFPEVARSFGLKPESLLSEVGIDRRALGDPEMRISAPAVGRLLELAAQQAKVETFGLHMAETRSIAILGPIGLLLREEPTVRHAVHSLAKYLFLHNETLVLHLDEVEDQAVVNLEIHLARQMPFRQGVELSIAVLYRILQSLIGPTWQPIVCFTHEPPARRDVHHRVLGARVDFRCNYNGLIFSLRDLERPVPGANPIFADHARRYLESLTNKSGATLESKVRDLVRVQLSSGRCTVERLAHQIGCDRARCIAGSRWNRSPSMQSCTPCAASSPFGCCKIVAPTSPRLRTCSAFPAPAPFPAGSSEPSARDRRNGKGGLEAAL